MDWTLLDTAWLRTVLVATAFATFQSGFSIRYGIRAAGWPVWTVRLATAITWAAVVAIPGRLLLPPLESDVERSVYRALFAASAPILAFFGFGLLATRRAIDRRRTRRAELFAEIRAIHDALPYVESAEDRARLEESLADLDRFLEPATFEYIQVTRSRITSWLDGGPLAGAREDHWAARVAPLVDSLRPASWRQAGRWTVWSQRIGGVLLSRASWLAVGAGLVLGRSVLAGPIVLAIPAAILAGYLLTWRWMASGAPLLAAAAAGLAGTAIVEQAARPAATLFSVTLVSVTLVAWSAFEWRRVRRRPSLRVVPPPDEPPRARLRAS